MKYFVVLFCAGLCLLRSAAAQACEPGQCSSSTCRCATTESPLAVADTPQVCAMILYGVGNGLLIFCGLKIFEVPGRSASKLSTDASDFWRLPDLWARFVIISLTMWFLSEIVDSFIAHIFCTFLPPHTILLFSSSCHSFKFITAIRDKE